MIHGFFEGLTSRVCEATCVLVFHLARFCLEIGRPQSIGRLTFLVICYRGPPSLQHSNGTQSFQGPTTFPQGKNRLHSWVVTFVIVLICLNSRQQMRIWRGRTFYMDGHTTFAIGSDRSGWDYIAVRVPCIRSN